MRQSALHRNYAAPAPRATVKSRLRLQQLWNAICNSFSLSPDPQIQERHVNGTLDWQVYDPKSDRTLRFSSESDLLVWLEDRHAGRVEPNPFSAEWY